MRGAPNPEPKFSQQASDAVDQCRALAPPPLAHAMTGQDRLRIVAIVLGPLALAEGLQQIRREQLRAMSEAGERACPEVCRAASLHRYDTRRQVRCPARKTTESELLEEQRALMHHPRTPRLPLLRGRRRQ